MAFPAPPTSPVYRKTKNDYVVYGPADLISEGVVEVTLRSGSKKWETVRGLGAIFQGDDQLSYRYGYLTESTTKATTATTTLNNTTATTPTSPASTDTEPEFVMPTEPISLDPADFAPDDGTDGGGEFYEAAEAA